MSEHERNDGDLPEDLVLGEVPEVGVRLEQGVEGLLHLRGAEPAEVDEGSDARSHYVVEDDGGEDVGVFRMARGVAAGARGRLETGRVAQEGGQ